MPRVTLLLTGVPQFLTLRDLSYNLDRLFNTDEIETFKVRDLPNHPQSNKRQVALDFRSGYDAMAAQEKLEGYTYELDNGREYTLHARINKSEEYTCGESPEYDGSQWYGDDWMALSMIPNVSDRDMCRAHAKLDAQLELLKKQKLVLEREKDLLNERMTLKRKYGSMVRSLYEDHSALQTQPNHVEHICETGKKVSSRSASQDRCSSSKHTRSRSREIRPSRSRSKDIGYVLPQIEWHDERTKTGELRSHSERSSAYSRDRRSRSRDYSRERRSRSRERRDYRYISRHRERRSQSKEPIYRRSASEERDLRARSSSKEWLAQKEPRSNNQRSRSRETSSHSRQQITRRSRSKDRMPYRSSRSPYRYHDDVHAVSRSDCERKDRRLRSPGRTTDQLAIKPRSPQRKSPSEWSVDSLKAAETPIINAKYEPNITHKDVTKVENDADIKGNKTNNTTKINDKKRRRIDKYNSKLRKAEKTALRVQALSKDIMILVAIVVGEIMDKNKIEISAANKVDLIKKIEALVQERLEPIARVKNNDDSEVLKKYKIQYPMQDDLKMIKQMLYEFPKLEVKEPGATVTVYGSSDDDHCINISVRSESQNNSATSVEIFDVDIDSGPTEQQCTATNLTPLEVSPVENTDNAPQMKPEPIIVIDIDSSEKPVPRHPQFVLVIKTLVKNMNKVIRTNKLGEEIKFSELKHVLRHTLRNMLKGYGYVSREEIIRKFREVYPMENDEQFVRNAIKDIRDGKYPGLTGHIGDVGDAPENNSPDDVIIIEKKYEIVTITDSDDDVEIKPKTEVINLDCEITDKLDPLDSSQAKPNSNPSQAKAGLSADQTKSESTNAGQDSTKAIQSNTDLDKATAATPNTTQPKTRSDVDQANVAAADVSQADINSAKIDHIVIEDNSPDYAWVATSTSRGRDMPDISSPGQTKVSPNNLGEPVITFSNPRDTNTDLTNLSQTNIFFANPVQGKTCVAKPFQATTSLANGGLENPGQAKTGCNICQSKTVPGNPSNTKTVPVIPSNAKTVPGNSSNTKTVPVNPSNAKTFPVNPSNAKSAPDNSSNTKTAPVNPSNAKSAPDNSSNTKTAPVNPSNAKTVLVNPSNAKTVPGNSSNTKTVPVNPSNAKTVLVNPSNAKTVPGNSSNTKTVPVNPSNAKTVPVNPSNAKTVPVNPSNAKTVPGNPSNTKTVPVNPSNAKTGPGNSSNTKTVPVNPSNAKTVPGNSSNTKTVPGNSSNTKTVPVNPSNAKTGPGNSSNTKPVPVNPGNAKTVPGNSSNTKTVPGNSSNTKTVPVIPSNAKTVPVNPSNAKTVPVNPSNAKTGAGNSSNTKTVPVIPSNAKTVPVNPSNAKTVPGNSSNTKTVPVIPSNAKTVPVNPSNAKTVPGNSSNTKTVPVNPSNAKTVPVNPSNAKTGAGNLSQAKTGSGYANTGTSNLNQAQTIPGKADNAKIGTGNLSQAKTGPGNLSQAKTGPGNLSQAKTGPGNPCNAKAGTGNLSQDKTGPGHPSNSKTGPGNLKQVNLTPGNTSQAKLVPKNAGQATKVSNNPSQIETGHGNISQAKSGPGNSGQAKTALGNSSQANTGLANPGQAMKDPVICQAELVPRNSPSKKEKQKRASLDSTIQNLESKEFEDTPETNDRSRFNEDSEVNTKNKEETDNNLKVTAITIVTSLDELIAKTAREPQNDVLSDEIKKEIDFDEEELDDSSSKHPDNAPRVTSITIMTSETELFSLGNKEAKDTREIKNETDVYYDAEDNLASDIERAFDDELNFGNSIMESECIEGNGLYSEQCTSNIIKNKIPEDTRTGQDDEETIESIVKYVASMY